MSALPIYLDYSATTPVDPRVAEKMIPYLTERFGNPASRSHAYGWEAEQAVENARTQVARLLNADAKEIVWTSGATESNNLALKGAAQFYRGKGKHLVTIRTEHKAVLDTMRELERGGFSVTYLDVDAKGLVDLDRFRAALRPDTVLASVMFVNNEIGVVQDIAALSELCRARGVIFHVDAAQATGTRRMGQRASARFTCGANHERGWKHRSMAADTSAASARGRSRRIRSSAWGKRFASHAKPWVQRTSAFGCCAIVCLSACPISRRSPSTAISNGACRTT